MTILMVLTNGFDPDPRVYKEAKVLVENGYDVEILAWDRENRHNDKEIEIVDGIEIKRFFIESKYGSGIKQMSAFLSFCLSARKYAAKKDYQFIHAHDIEGMLAAIIIDRNKKLIWDMHEFFDGFTHPGLRDKVYGMMAGICFRYANGIIYVVESQKSRYTAKVKSKTLQTIVMNCADQYVFDNFNRKPADKLRVSFIGTVREFETIKLMMDVAAKYPDVVFYIHGAGVSYQDIKNISGNYSNTILKGRFDFKNVKSLYEETDIVYSIYDSDMLNVKEAFPAKGFESIISRTPVIANKNTYFGDLVEKTDIGFVIDEKTSTDLENVIKAVLADRSILVAKASNIDKIRNDFLWETQSAKLVEFYKDIQVTHSELHRH